jgi:predicted phosphatase
MWHPPFSNSINIFYVIAPIVWKGLMLSFALGEALGRTHCILKTKDCGKSIKNNHIQKSKQKIKTHSIKSTTYINTYTLFSVLVTSPPPYPAIKLLTCIICPCKVNAEQRVHTDGLLYGYKQLTWR